MTLGSSMVLLHPSLPTQEIAEARGIGEPEIATRRGYYLCRNGWTALVIDIDPKCKLAAGGDIFYRNPTGHERRQPGQWQANGRYRLVGEHPLDLVSGPAPFKP